MKEEDFVERLWIANTHDTLLTFTSAGRVFWLKVHQLPDAGPNARGRPIVNLLPLEPDEKVQAVQPVREFADDRFVFFATRNGTVKKTPLTRIRVPAAARQDRDRPRRGRCARRRADHRRHARHHAVRVERQGRAFRRRRSALDGPHRDRRARHAPRAGEHVVSLIVVDGDGRHPDRDRTRLRQAHRARRISAQGPRHAGRHRDPVFGAQWRADRRGAARRGARADADLEPGHAGAHARGGSRARRAQHAGRDADPLAGRRAARRRRARRARSAQKKRSKAARRLRNPRRRSDGAMLTTCQAAPHEARRGPSVSRAEPPRTDRHRSILTEMLWLVGSGLTGSG